LAEPSDVIIFSGKHLEEDLGGMMAFKKIIKTG
jgi:hypothetical protein